MVINEDRILWPGGQEEKPVGVNISKHLRVVTIQETPFVYTEPYDPKKGCNSSQLTSESARMKCPRNLENGKSWLCEGHSRTEL